VTGDNPYRLMSSNTFNLDGRSYTLVEEAQDIGLAGVIVRNVVVVEDGPPLIALTSVPGVTLEPVAKMSEDAPQQYKYARIRL